MLPLPLLATLLACAPGGISARAAFVQDVLVEDNRIWLTRDPALVARKFEAMAADPYDFMRGTVALHFADLARPRPGRTPTRFLGSAEATATLIVGDPHPENATLCHPEPGQGGAPTLEFVDLDAAGYGPWTIDVRRAALGLQVLGTSVEGCGPACRDASVAAMAGAYAAHIEDPALAPPLPGLIVEDLIERAAERGPTGRRIERLVREGDDGARRFLHTEDTRLQPLSPEESALLDAALEDWRATGLQGGPMRVLDRARRLGSGISSQPALRFAVLWDGGEDGPEDDRLLQIREVVDAPVPPGRALAQVGVFDDNAERVEYAARVLWSRPDADPLAAGLRARGYDLKSVSWMDWLQPIDHDKIAEEWAAGDYGPADLVALGATLGHVLAASHARGDTASGAPAGPVIRADLERGGGAPALRAEVLAHAREDRDRLLADHGLFVELLQTEGPLLGASDLVEDVR
jgi:uncharacterized protein (DUF2252 family)